MVAVVSRILDHTMRVDRIQIFAKLDLMEQCLLESSSRNDTLPDLISPTVVCIATSCYGWRHWIPRITPTRRMWGICRTSYLLP